MQTHKTILTQVSDTIKTFPFTQYGFAHLEKPLSMDIYTQWVHQGFGGEMEYLKKHLPQKEEPQKLLPKAQSAIVIAQNYGFPSKQQELPLKSLKVSLYAQEEDYHFWFKDQLKNLAQKLSRIFPQEEFLPMVDSSPVLERDLAYRAGLGWFGKNTCLIDRKQGSLFFIGEIYTSLKLSPQLKPSLDFCGTCQRCIEVCPTQALSDSKQLDARKCISYLNIESKTAPPKELRSLMEDWFFGCDLCQTVCPWNQKIFGPELHSPPCPSPEGLIKDLEWVLTSSNKKIQKTLKKTALSRAGALGLKRNALIVAGNLKLHPLAPVIESYLPHEKLGELAQWTLLQLQ